MTADQSPGRTHGETHGQEQEPVEAGERDTVQERQAEHEGKPPVDDPAEPDTTDATTDTD